MARRNTNSRVNPDAIQDTNIQPASSMTNQLQTFAPDTSKGIKTASLYKGLADLGQGVADVNALAMQLANDNSMDAYAKTSEENRKEWAKVSKNMKGMAKFNPWNKEAYNRLRSSDITNKYINQLSSDPDLKYKTPEQVEDFINNTQALMMNDLQQEGLQQRNYADLVENYQTRANNLRNKYVQDHAEVEMERTDSKISDSGAGWIGEANYAPLYDAKKDNLDNLKGQLEKGNIDLYNRPQVDMGDGSTATVRSMGFTPSEGKYAGKQVLIPTISPDGKVWDEQQAIDNFYKTGQHLGVYDSIENSDAAAQSIHLQQENYYMSRETQFAKSLDGVVAVGDSIGASDYRNATNVVSAVTKAVLAEPDKYPTSWVEQNLSNYTIHGKKINEIIPNFNYELKKQLKAAKRSNLDDRNLEYQSHILDMKQSQLAANKDMYNFMNENPAASLDEISNYAKTLVDNYDLEEIGVDYVLSTMKDKRSLSEASTIITDKAVLEDLTTKAAFGTLTSDMVGDALRDKLINPKDALALLDRLDRDESKAVKSVDAAYKDFEDIIKPDNPVGSHFKYNKSIINQAKGIINDTYTALKEGQIGAKEAEKTIRETTKKVMLVHKIQTTKNKDKALMLRAAYINAQQAPVYTDQAVTALNSMGLLRNGGGFKSKVVVTSAPQRHRKITFPDGHTKEGQHIGYDLKADKNTQVHTLNMASKVIYAGHEATMGNYALVQYANGSYMRYLHLGSSVKHLQGKPLSAGAYLCRAGSSGESTGIHVHVDFWDKNMNLISAEKFMKDMK